MNEDALDYASRIRQLRERFHLTQVELAELMGVTHAAVSHWETGRTQPSDAGWQQITRAEALGLDAIDEDFATGSVIRTRNRLWRVEGQPEDDVLVASTIDGGEAQQLRLYVPFEDIPPGQLEPPSPEIIGHVQTQDLLLRAYHLSLLHGTAPLLSLQRSRVIPKDYQLAPVVMALEIPRVRLLLADDVGLGDLRIGGFRRFVRSRASSSIQGSTGSEAAL